MITVHYFASVREALSRDRDEIELTNKIQKVSDLTDLLALQDENFSALVSNENKLLTAVNQTVVGADHPVHDDDEVAYFPPMTGG